MVFDTGLSAEHLAEVTTLYSSSHDIRCSVQVMDLEHVYVQDISDAVLDGQITINWDGDDATRSLEILLFDPDFLLGFDVPDSSQGVWFFDRMIHARVEMYAPEQDRWVEFPMFTGPVRGFKRTGVLVTLQCVGKDIFVRQSWPSYTIAKGTNKIDAIKKVLKNAGETKFRFEATSTQKLSEDKVINRNLTLSPWGWCRARASEMGLRLFYNGNGEACLRPLSASSIDWVVTDGDSGLVLTDPDVTGDYSRIANVVRAVSSSDSKIYGDANVPDTSTISPKKLKRGGQPLYFGYEYLSDSVKTKADAVSAAKATLADRQRASYAIQFDCLPLYAAEECDVIQVRVRGDVATTPLLSASFGITPDAPMTIGYRRMVAPVLAKIRRV